MKILNVNNYHYVRGGSDRHYLDLGELLIKNGHEVVWFSTSFQKEPAKGAYFVAPGDFKRLSVKNVFNFLYSYSARNKIQQIIKIEKPDIAHLHIYYGHFTSSILAPLKNAGIPIIQTLHDYRLICPANNLASHGETCEACRGWFLFQSGIKKCHQDSFSRSCLSALEVYVSRMNGAESKIDHFVAPSNFLRNKLIQYGMNPKKISTIHNFIRVADYEPGDLVGEYFVFLGRLEKIKGVFVFLKAAARLPSTQFLIVGTGECEKEVVDFVEREKLKNVRLLGYKNKQEIKEVLKGAIGLVVPSLCYEIFGLVILEAFAMAKPVLGADIGGIPELIDHGTDGFLFRPGDVDGLVKAILWLKTHPNEASRMGLKGREKVERRFDSAVYYPKLMDIYKRLTNEARKIDLQASTGNNNRA